MNDDHVQLESFEEDEVIRNAILDNAQKIVDCTDKMRPATAKAVCGYVSVMLEGMWRLERLHNEMALEALRNSDEYLNAPF